MDPADLLGRRNALRMSQAELGRALGVARNTVARWERGELEMRHAELIALALDRLEAKSPAQLSASNLPTCQPSSALSSGAKRSSLDSADS
jgi:transcriptional regulator with XRE-family HTH domain